MYAQSNKIVHMYNGQHYNLLFLLLTMTMAKAVFICCVASIQTSKRSGGFKFKREKLHHSTGSNVFKNGCVLLIKIALYSLVAS